MNKKRYIAPALEVEIVESDAIIAASAPAVTVDSEGNIEAGDVETNVDNGWNIWGE